MSTKIQCPDCGTEISVSIGEHTRGGELTWSASYWCPQCDYAEELDGNGQLPDELRKIVFEKEGMWHLVLESMGEQTSRGFKALKDVFGLTTTELSEARSNLPIILHSGTKTEASFYKDSLVDLYEGIVVVMVKSDL